tara:strand:- start:115 stop:675 length:561 start_codon:yes stop_codon:yes gene_type:complete
MKKYGHQTMHLQSLDGCRLAIGSYPPFHYDARGGGGKGTLYPTEKENIWKLSFSSKTFSIPPLNWQTTKFLYLPLPPGLKIEMSMDKLEGTINKVSGEILLEFESRFILRIGSIFNFPDLLVKTSLKTGKVKSYLYEEEGLVRQENGKSKLVGVSMIPITGHKLLDTFLGLPNEALAILECEIKEY